ncbi:aspartate/methionine/tyrosine aminotransferase [Anaerosolibacter carboniphilus]|uniref:Aminotransferase n=1 Tax=Anaerosolibacter carboniphilus TaxID=1417629 RepID=A0A841L0L0_9FIRM|nr:aminotransferase [Anaerosolibacter carboniphilus]MBB6218118.1 aspartate/methionine/tyrosine aminotransferase [Anaerosolibacter carboniphilus]
MKIRDFGVEMWMAKYENDALYNIAETCVASITVDELLAIAGMKDEAFEKIGKMKMTYGAIEGSMELRSEICKLYKHVETENVTVTHGTIGANALVYDVLVEPNDHVISVLPTYQQHYSIPESLGAKVDILPLRWENGFLPDIDELKSLIKPNTKMISINNPNNPTGAVMGLDLLNEIVEVAKSVDAYVLCDEVYRGLDHVEGFTPSIVDLYDKGISTASLSKTFSLAGLRIGWVVALKDVIVMANKRRDYNIISCGMIDDYLATIALKNKDTILTRSLSIVRTNIEILNKWVNESKHVEYIRPKGGTTAFLKYSRDIKSEELCQDIFEKAGVMLVPGTALDMEGYLRVGYANSSEVLIEGLKRLGEYFDRYWA